MSGNEQQGVRNFEADAERRRFLATCGRFAVVTPPAITLLLSTSLTSEAIALSGGRGAHHEHHEHHDHDRDRDDD